MPQPRMIDLNPKIRQEPTGLEHVLTGFANKFREDMVEGQDIDQLKQIYGQYQEGRKKTGVIEDLQQRRQEEARMLEDAKIKVQTQPGLSPTARVNAMNQLQKFGEHNLELQKLATEETKKQKTLNDNRNIIKDLEHKRGLPQGSLSAYENDPKMAEQVSRPPKEGKQTQASQPINPDQLKRIQDVRNNPAFESASPAKKYQILTDAGVSRENAKAEADIYAEEGKIDTERNKTIAKKQAEADVAFVNEQAEKIPQLFDRQQTMEAASKLNEEGVTGGLWDAAMQRAGLLQYTSEGYRQFASYAKDAVRNQNIKGVVGSQISQMEFGFFRDATISERFSQEANEQIIKKEMLATKYQQLYADITKDLVAKNDGEIPPNIQQKVNDEFAKQSKGISRQVQKTARNFNAIQNVPKGMVLMFDKNRQPLHVPEDQVAEATKDGATLK